MKLRKKVSVEDFFSGPSSPRKERKLDNEDVNVGSDEKEKLKKFFDKTKGTKKAIILNKNFEEMKEVTPRGFGMAVKGIKEKPYALVVDGTATVSMLRSAEDSGVKIIVAKNFASTDTKIKLLSL